MEFVAVVDMKKSYDRWSEGRIFPKRLEKLARQLLSEDRGIASEGQSSFEYRLCYPAPVEQSHRQKCACGTTKRRLS